MPRKLYISLFVALAVLFVPVVLEFGIVAYVVPVIWTFPGLVKTLFSAKFVKALVLFAYLTAGLLVSYTAARATFWLSWRSRAETVRLAIQVIVLLALFSCSFLRVITYHSIQGGGGTYTVWGAVARSVERYGR